MTRGDCFRKRQYLGLRSTDSATCARNAQRRRPTRRLRNPRCNTCHIFLKDVHLHDEHSALAQKRFEFCRSDAKFWFEFGLSLLLLVQKAHTFAKTKLTIHNLKQFVPYILPCKQNIRSEPNVTILVFSSSFFWIKTNQSECLSSRNIKLTFFSWVICICL